MSIDTFDNQQGGTSRRFIGCHQAPAHKPAEMPVTVRLTLNMETNRVYANGVLIELRPTEFRMLHFFMNHKERVYSRTQLLDQVWERKVLVEERTVDVHVQRLRVALRPFGMSGLVQTVRGRGYRFSHQH
jgi:two-component system phosphate regulon response regulator PhoB